MDERLRRLQLEARKGDPQAIAALNRHIERTDEHRRMLYELLAMSQADTGKWQSWFQRCLHKLPVEGYAREVVVACAYRSCWAYLNWWLARWPEWARETANDTRFGFPWHRRGEAITLRVQNDLSGCAAASRVMGIAWNWLKSGCHPENAEMVREFTQPGNLFFLGRRMSPIGWLAVAMQPDHEPVMAWQCMIEPDRLGVLTDLHRLCVVAVTDWIESRFAPEWDAEAWTAEYVRGVRWPAG